jgi:hypothetical protein
MAFYKLIKNKFLKFIDSDKWNNPGFVLSLTIISYLLLVIIRFVIFSLFIEAGAVGDDYGYKGMALSFFKTGDFYKLNYARKLLLPNYLYPLVISPAFFFSEHFYIFIKLINSLLINSAIFPIFLIAKEFMNYQKAYFISMIALFIPFMNIGYMLMCESLYLPLFLLAFYFCYKLLTGLKLKYAFLSGMAIALLYLTKPQALFFTAAFLITTIVVLFLSKDNEQRKRIIYLTTVSISCLIVGVIILNIILLGNPGLSLQHYSGVAKRNLDFSNLELLSFPRVVYLMLSNISFFFILYLLPFFVSVVLLKKAIKEKKEDKQTFLLIGLIFSLVMFMVVLFLAFNAPIYRRELRIPSRFYFMIYPFYIIAFAAFYKKIDWNKAQKIIIAISFVLTLIINGFVSIPKIISAQKFCYMVPNMDAVWIWYARHKWDKPGFIMFFLVQMMGLAVLVYYFFRKKKTLYPYVIFFLITAIISNYAVLVNINQKNRGMLNFRKNYLSFVREKIPLYSQNVALISYKPFYKWGYFSFWLHYDYTTKLQLEEHTTIEEDMLPANTRWVLIEGDYHVGFPVKAHYKKGRYNIIQIPKKAYFIFP